MIFQSSRNLFQAQDSREQGPPVLPFSSCLQTWAFKAKHLPCGPYALCLSWEMTLHISPGCRRKAQRPLLEILSQHAANLMQGPKDVVLLGSCNAGDYPGDPWWYSKENKACHKQASTLPTVLSSQSSGPQTTIVVSRA